MFGRKIVIALMSILVLTGCNKKTVEEEPVSETTEATAPVVSTVSFSDFEKIEDVFSSNLDIKQCGNSPESYFVIFENNGTLYRAYADISPETLDKIISIDMNAKDYDEKRQAIVNTLEVKEIENLTEKIPSQDELNKWVGKKGQDLIDDGWIQGYGYDLKNMKFNLFKGPFAYSVTFKKDNKKYKDTDNLDVPATISPLTITSITYDGLGDGSLPLE